LSDFDFSSDDSSSSEEDEKVKRKQGDFIRKSLPNQVFGSNLELGCHRLSTADAIVTQRANYGSD
jgi:hypothetical protein